MTLEKEIERAFNKRIKELGGTSEKFTSPGRRSVPDRLVTMPGGDMFFVELKAEGKKPTEAQERDHARRRSMGCDVYVIDNMGDARAFKR